MGVAMAPIDQPPDPGQSGGTWGPSLLGRRGSLSFPTTMETMRPIALLVVAALVLVVGGCGDASRPSDGMPSAAAPSASTTADASARPDDTDAPAPTPVPGGQTVEPGPIDTHKPTTTRTNWGVILDSVPDDLPRYPGAKVVDSPDEPVSAAYETKASVDEVARWYRTALEEAAWSTLDLSDPLEDGSRVLDSQGDIPECQVQTTFRPEGDATMITVLYAAGCIALGG